MTDSVARPEWVELTKDRCEAIAAAVYRGACITDRTHQRALAVSLRIFSEARLVRMPDPYALHYPDVPLARMIPRATFEELTGDVTDEAAARTH